MDFQCWGISHKSTSLEIREKFAFNKDQINEMLSILKSKSGFQGGIFLSTCNRTEFYTISERSKIKHFDNFLLASTSNKFEIRKNDQYLFSGIDAFNHLLEVMTGIDSMIVGEPDIFGQVKKSFLNSKNFSFMTEDIESIFSGAIKLSKHVRTETKLSENPISIASVVDSEIKGSKSIALIGGGDVSKALISRFKKRQLKVDLFNRSNIEIDGIVSKDLSEIKSSSKISDTFVIAAFSEEPFIGLEDLDLNKEITIFDLAIPRNIVYDVSKVKSVNVITLDQLSEKISKNLDSRKESVEKAKTLIKSLSQKEFFNLKNKKALNNEQKKLRNTLEVIKDEAMQSAKKKLNQGKDVEKILDELADEIKSKNAYHISKTLSERIKK